MLSSDYTGFCKLLYDWQTLIAGGLAIVAAIIGSIAAYYVGNAQITASKQRDRLQARCIAVGIAPELLQLEVSIDRAEGIIDQFPLLANSLTIGIISIVESAAITIPPIINMSAGQFFILGEPAGPTMLQLLSILLQYNLIIQTLAQQLQQHVHLFNPPKHQRDLSGNITLIKKLVADAQREIAPLRDLAQ